MGKIRDESFGEKIKLPQGYRQLWGELSKYLSSWQRGQFDRKEDPVYIKRRVNGLIPDAGNLGTIKNLGEISFERSLRALPVIDDNVSQTVHYGDDNPHQECYDIKLEIRPSIVTVLSENSISRYRSLKPGLPQARFYPGSHPEIGDPFKVQCLFELFEFNLTNSNFQKCPSLESVSLEQGVLRSLPSSLKLERNVKGLYDEIGRARFEEYVEKRRNLEKVLMVSRSPSILRDSLSGEIRDYSLRVFSPILVRL